MPNRQIFYNYKRTKEYLCKNNGSVWYNDLCKINQPTAKYISIKIKGNNKVILEMVPLNTG